MSWRGGRGGGRFDRGGRGGGGRSPFLLVAAIIKEDLRIYMPQQLPSVHLQSCMLAMHMGGQHDLKEFANLLFYAWKKDSLFSKRAIFTLFSIASHRLHSKCARATNTPMVFGSTYNLGLCRFGGGRFGGRGGYDEGPPAEVVEAGLFTHTCEGEIVVKLTNEKVTSRLPHITYRVCHS